MTECQYALTIDGYVCERCGDVRTRAVRRRCVGVQIAARSIAPLAKCSYRGDVLQTINGRVAGCGCASSTVEVYECRRFKEPVIKQGYPPCLDSLREQVPGATGRTCRECEEWKQQPAGILHVTPRPDWQHVTTRGAFALRGTGLRCAECSGKELASRLDAGPSIVFVHAFSVPAADVVRHAQRLPNTRFVVVSHSHENHVLTWPGFFADIRTVLESGLSNLSFAGSENTEHWKRLGYSVLRWHWPVVMPAAYSQPPASDPPVVLITSRMDLVKALPSQILAAAILQRERGIRVALSLGAETGPRMTGLDNLIHAARLTVDRWPWVSHDGFLQRLRRDVSIVLQPSMSETFNYVSWEAGSVGRPWVGSDAIRHTPTGWRADPNDPAEIADVAGQILDDYDAASQRAYEIAVDVGERNNAAYRESILRLIGDMSRYAPVEE